MSYNYGGGGYGQDQYNNNTSGFQPQGGAPPAGPGYGGGGFDQNNAGYGAPQQHGAPQQYGQQQQQGHAGSYYGDQAPGASDPTNYGSSTSGSSFSGSREMSDQSNEDLPYPWVREWDEQFKQIYYVNPTTTPPSTSWTHPGLAPGQEHPEQLQTHREAEQLYEQEVGPGGAQNGERGFVTNAAAGFVGYKVLSSLLGKHSKPSHGGGGGHGGSSGPGWGTYAMGAGAGVGGAYLLSKLFANKNANKYGHQMGPPPFGGGGYGGHGGGHGHGMGVYKY